MSLYASIFTTVNSDLVGSPRVLFHSASSEATSLIKAHQSQVPSGAIRSSAQGNSVRIILPPAFSIASKIRKATSFLDWGTESQQRVHGNPNLAPSKAVLPAMKPE